MGRENGDRDKGMETQDPMTRKRTTVKDVARVAGVSPGTVSNAISGQRRVDQKTRDKIDAAIRELGYVPNLSARGMRTGRTNTIAIFSSMPTAVAAGPSKLGFLMEIAASAAVMALEHNLALVLVPPIERPETMLATIPFDGAVLVEPSRDDPYRAILRERNVPVVVIGSAEEEEGPAVILDYAHMADLIITHLLETDARQILLIVGSSARASNRVFRAVYEKRMASASLPMRVIEVPETHAEAGAQAAMLGEIDAGTDIDAVVAPIDAMAAGVMTALRARGLNVPQDVRVATRYDGIRARSETPALTALDLHLDVVARLSIQALIETLEGAEEAPVLTAPKPQLIVRGSSR